MLFAFETNFGAFTGAIQKYRRLRHVARRHYSPVCGQCLRVQFDPYKMRQRQRMIVMSFQD